MARTLMISEVNQNNVRISSDREGLKRSRGGRWSGTFSPFKAAIW